MGCDNFIRVDGVKMYEGERPFYFIGANCYYLLTFAANGGVTISIAEETLLDAKRMGITVLRIWAFNDGKRWESLQPKPGVYSEQVFEGLDWIIYKCKCLKIRLILCLSNYWSAFGGMLQYVKWSYPQLTNPQPEDFYNSVFCYKVFHEFIYTIVCRINSITNVEYRNDTTIMAWELCNEPEDLGFKFDMTLADWIDQTSKFIKFLDSNHLVTVGDQGFFDADSPKFDYCTPKYAQKCGTDFITNGKSKCIDYLSVHLWPNQWLSPSTTSFLEILQLAEIYIEAHVKAAKYLGKPLVVEEFGYKSNMPIEKYEYYSQVLSQVYKSIIHDKGCPLHGVMFWMLCAPEFPDYGGYAIYPPNQQRHGENPINQFTSQLIVKFSNKFNVLFKLQKSQRDMQFWYLKLRGIVVQFIGKYFRLRFKQQST
eukprot:TRINITY_DN3500_c1_g1_i1.p1 TRINITY_DN3500_c1_g1~~TRINITY_DN3500_c1_g1_i1.p1  ORF type:complete len:424 (-),score=18.96 TRINITY_DN3500_c1_g1_i1:28-1299(-)